MTRGWNGIGRIQRDLLNFCKMVPRSEEYLNERLRGQLHDYVIPGLVQGGHLTQEPSGLFKTTDKGKACLTLMPEQYKKWLKRNDAENAAARQ